MKDIYIHTHTHTHTQVVIDEGKRSTPLKYRVCYERKLKLIIS